MFKRLWKAFDDLFDAFDDDIEEMDRDNHVRLDALFNKTNGTSQTIVEEETKPDGTRIKRTITTYVTKN